MKKLLFLLVCLVSLNIHAQGLRTTTADKEPWVGGACCTSGINYHFVFEYEGNASEIELDSVYIQGNWYAAPSVAEGTMQIDTTSSGATFTCVVIGYGNISNRMNQLPWEGENPDIVALNPGANRRPPMEQGEVVFTYKKGDTRLELAIPKLTTIYRAAKPSSFVPTAMPPSQLD